MSCLKDNSTHTRNEAWCARQPSECNHALYWSGSYWYHSRPLNFNTETTFCVSNILKFWHSSPAWLSDSRFHKYCSMHPGFKESGQSLERSVMVIWWERFWLWPQSCLNLTFKSCRFEPSIALIHMGSRIYVFANLPNSLHFPHLIYDCTSRLGSAQKMVHFSPFLWAPNKKT